MRWWWQRPSAAEFDDELRTHLSLLTERYEKQGLSPAEAAAAARRQFGNVRALKDARADRSRWHAIGIFGWDLRFAIRGLRRQPGFAATAVTLLALGIGANTAIFSVFDEVLLRPLPVEQPRQLALVSLSISPTARFQGAARLGWVRVSEFLGPDAGIPRSVFDKLRTAAAPFSGLVAEGVRVAAELEISGTVAAAGNVRAAFVSGNYFSVLGVGPAAGRTFVDADDDRARGPVIVISDGFWQRTFARDAGVVGRAVTLNGTSATVIGITRAGFEGSAVGQATDVWIPLRFRQSISPAAPSDLTLIGRLRPEVNLADARVSV